MRRLCVSALALVAGCGLSFAAGFTSQDLSVPNSAAGISLGATLTRPADGSVKGTIVLASGSGSQNRDEEVLGHKPFRTIAEYLSTHGYAILRMDDRGVGESGGNPAVTTTADDVSDIMAAFAVLDSIVGVDVPKGVIGHSEGGVTAVRTALADPRCRFIVTLAAPAWSGDSIIMSQARKMAVDLTGRWDGEPVQRRLLDLVASPLPDFALREAIYMTLVETAGEVAKLPEAQRQLRLQAGVMAKPRYRSMVRYNPAADIAAVRVPWLALNGDRDTQVLPANLETIRALNPSVQTQLLPSHNHLFQRCTTGLISEYQTIAEDLSPLTLEAILQFLEAL